MSQRTNVHPEDGGSMVLRNVGILPTEKLKSRNFLLVEPVGSSAVIVKPTTGYDSESVLSTFQLFP